MFKKINMRKVYATVLSALLALPLVSITATPAQAAVATCGTAGTPAVTWLNDPKYYIGLSDAYDAGYIGYTVTPTAAVKNMWVGLSNFTGGLISLAPNQPQYLPSGPTEANTSKTTYFLSKTTASANSTTDQSHTVTIYEGNPNSVGAVALCTVTKTFTDIEDTITANANKVNSISTSASTAVMGNTVTTTVFGGTGTIGANWI